ncbi:MAG: autotransporter-associated beta strand repeat-containing protein, partial [Chthoniobacteraceae bacterium]|nr:autotransporter-associated beta strand repeat-containing protein [Chthoniobacteraceae bacterium]
TALTINGLWNRSAGATVNFDLSSSANNVLQTQTVSNTNGIVGGWMTITDSTGTGFATYANVTTNVTNPVVRYTGASTLAASTNNATTNYTTSGAVAFASGAHSVNSLAIDTGATAGSLAIVSGSPLNITSGGLLMTGGNDYAITGGQLGSSNSELIVHQYGTGKLTVSSTISSGTGSLTKTGGGTLALNGANTYSGATNIYEGTLALGSSGSIDNSSAINVAKGATFDVLNKTGYTVGGSQVLTNNGAITGSVTVSGALNGTGAISGDLTVNGGGLLSPGNSPGTQTIGGDLTLLDNATLAMQLRKDDTTASGALVAGTDFDQIIVGGQVTLGGTLALQLGGTLLSSDVFTLILDNSDTLGLSGSFSAITINGTAVTGYANNTFTYNNQQYALVTVNADGIGTANDLELMAVPEPGTWAMLVSGLGTLVGIQRLRRRSARLS